MDLTTIGAAIGLVSTATGATTNAVALAEKIKGLVNSGDPQDSGEAAKLLGNLASELTSANIMNLELSKQLKTLSQELQKQDEFEKQKARYELFETTLGDLVLRLRQDRADGQPIHYVCPVCMNKDKLISFVTGDQYYKNCQTNREHGFSFAQQPDLYSGSSYI